MKSVAVQRRGVAPRGPQGPTGAARGGGVSPLRDATGSGGDIQPRTHGAHPLGQVSRADGGHGAAPGAADRPPEPQALRGAAPHAVAEAPARGCGRARLPLEAERGRRSRKRASRLLIGPRRAGKAGPAGAGRGAPGCVLPPSPTWPATQVQVLSGRSLLKSCLFPSPGRCFWREVSRPRLDAGLPAPAAGADPFLGRTPPDCAHW